MDMSKAIDEIFRNRKSFIVIGLTGKTGSGCTTVADILCKKAIDISTASIDSSPKPSIHYKKKNIITSFFKKNWSPFFKIQVRDIITTYILECKFETIHNYIIENGIHTGGLSDIKQKFNEFKEKNKCLDPLFSERMPQADPESIYNYIKKELPEFTDYLKNFFEKDTDGEINSIYQIFGDNIRRYGDVVKQKEINTENIFTLSDRINKIIKALRKYNEKNNIKDYFVIDAFKNPLEVRFFQERYAGFYLFAINCEEETRKDRLIHLLNWNLEKIDKIEANESPRENFLTNYDSFLSQDVATCIQNADVFISNLGKHDSKKYTQLNDQLVRYISLIQHPGLITPSTDEKLMQIACTTKLNSGCLSRQVGAVVTNSQGALKSIGWNSTPENQTPCLYRNTTDLLRRDDNNAYSHYERTNDKFQSEATKYQKTHIENSEKRGITCSYCFKSLYNKIMGDKNQVHTRALHAEENAFLQIAKHGGEGIDGGKLYSTASPCELCAKKACQLGIKEIIYIDPYPGITDSHILGNGHNPPKLKLFSGAIGSAYHRLYHPIIPFKDELKAMSHD